MALKRSDMVAVSTSASSFTLTPDMGESILVKDIQIVPNAAVQEYLTVRTGRKTVGYFHIGTSALNQLPLRKQAEPMKTVISYLQEKGIDMTFPVGEGESIVFSTTNTYTLLVVRYEVYDANDILPTRLNGSKAEEFIFMNYGTNAASITTATETRLTSYHNPVEFPAFPFGEIVPAKTEITVLGVGFPDVTRTGATHGTDDIYTNRLKFVRDREVMFDAALTGLWVRGLTLGGAANTTTYYNLGTSDLSYNGSSMYVPFTLFSSPIKFEAGEELAIFVSTLLDNGGGTISANELFCALPMHVKRV